jgi:nucleotide-binding universal stress UspA family protein
MMRILLAIDGSPAADRARDLVAALPWREGGRLRIVSVAPTRPELLGVPWSLAATADDERIEDEVLRIHRDALDTAEREMSCTRGDVAIESVLVRGRAATVIVGQAREMDADLVVVGHRGMGPWESMLLGSVSAEVVDHAPCPVLVARDDQLGPIVLADDGSSNARVAECVVMQWPIFSGLPVTVVTVTEDVFPYAAAVAPMLYSEAMTAYEASSAAERAGQKAASEAAATRLRDAGFEATAEVRNGDAAHQIIASASEHDAGIIVVGTRGQTGLRRLVLGSVARNVLLHAPCSVLVVREGARIDGVLIDRRIMEPELVGAFG